MSHRKEAGARVLAAIDDFEKEHGYPPTYREISNIVGVYHSVVHHHVERLREAGLLYAPERTIARGLRVTDAGHEFLAARSVPSGD